MAYNIALIPGDGIGKEVIPEELPVDAEWSSIYEPAAYRNAAPSDEDYDMMASTAAITTLRDHLRWQTCLASFDDRQQAVAEALIEKLGGEAAFVCPAFPTNKRTIYKGHLFVGDQLLSDSPMKDHPLTPMRDSNLVAVTARQTASDLSMASFSRFRSDSRITSS